HLVISSWVVRRTGRVGSRLEGAHPHYVLFLDGALDAVDRARDSAREGREDADDGEGDHTQHDGVLRHRLTLLALARPLDQVDALGERHFHVTSSRGRSVKCVAARPHSRSLINSASVIPWESDYAFRRTTGGPSRTARGC